MGFARIFNNPLKPLSDLDPVSSNYNSSIRGRLFKDFFILLNCNTFFNRCRNWQRAFICHFINVKVRDGEDKQNRILHAKGVLRLQRYWISSQILWVNNKFQGGRHVLVSCTWIAAWSQALHQGLYILSIFTSFYLANSTFWLAIRIIRVNWTFCVTWCIRN